MQERYSPTAWFLISHLIPLRGLFLLRTLAIQASLIALGLASVLISHFQSHALHLRHSPRGH